MDELPAHAKAVLRRAQQHDQCHDEDARQRVREGVARAVGASVVPSDLGRARVATQLAAPASGAPLFGLGGKLTVATVLVALVGAGIALRRHNAQDAAPHDTRVSALVASPSVVGSAPPAPASPVAPPAAGLRGSAQDRPPIGPHGQGRRSRAASVGPRVPTRDTLDAEVGLLRELEGAILRRDAHEARRLLRLHRERFPQPVLLEERQGLSALLGCMDHSDAAHASARAFVARYPNSVLTERVLRACAPAVR
jgi:hypothetical protein